MCQPKECVQRLEAANFVSHELKTDCEIGCIQRFAALRWPPKKNLIINRDVSGGYCKTAVSRWPFSQQNKR